MEDVKRSFWWRWLPVLGYMGIITFLSSRTSHQLPSWSLMKFDKVLHTLEYGGLGFLLCRALPVKTPSTRIMLAAALGLAFGVVDEFHQTFVPGRSGNDLGDLTADWFGSTLGAISFVVLVRWFGKESWFA